jgi:hypothetical protein
LLCSCLVCLLGTMSHYYPRSDPTPIGPTAMPSPPPFASPSPMHCTTPAARDSNLGSGNHDMSRLSTLAYPNDAPIHGLADIPLRLLPTDIGCGTLAPRSRQDTATHSARDPNLDSANHDMSILSALAYLNDSPIHGLTDIPPSTPTSNGCWVWHPRSSHSPRHGNTHWLLATQTSTVAGNHDMSRLSTPAYLTDAPIHGLTDKLLAYFQRVLGGALALAPRTGRHTTPQLWPHKRPHGHQTAYMHLLSMLVALRTSTWQLLPFVQP